MAVGRGRSGLRRRTVLRRVVHHRAIAGAVAIRTPGLARSRRFGVGNVVAVSEQCTVKTTSWKKKEKTEILTVYYYTPEIRKLEIRFAFVIRDS